MKKVLVLGSGGMLGHMVYDVLSGANCYEVYGTVSTVKIRETDFILDVRNIQDVDVLIQEIKPDVIINCIGILINGAKNNPADAIFINAYFPNKLVEFARSIESRIIHISTDCVFSGKKGNYSELDLRDAEDTYGRSKSLGELSNEYDVTLRTSIIGPEIGENPKGLFDWFFNQKARINGYSRAYWGGVTTLQLAKTIIEAIEQKPVGLYHITNNEKISKYDLLFLFKNIWNLGQIDIRDYQQYQSDKSLVAKKEPFYSRIPPYSEMLYELKEYMLLHKIQYEKYFSVK